MTRLQRAVLSAAVVLGLAEPASADNDSTWGHRVNAVSVNGLRMHSASRVAAQLETQPGTILSPAAVARDVHALWRLGLFNDVRVDAEQAAGGARVRFSVTERQPLRSIEFVGNHVLASDELLKLAELTVHAPLSGSKIAFAEARIRDGYAKRGYALASVSHKIVRGGALRLVIAENRSVKIRKIRFVGNRVVGDRELGAILPTKRGRILPWGNDDLVYREADLETGMAKIAAYYHDRGFPEVTIQKPTLVFSEDGQWVSIDVPIQEGHRFSIGAVTVSGDVQKRDPEVEKQLRSLRSGARFNRSQVGSVMSSIARVFRDRGYAFANVEPKIASRGRRADIDFVVKRGARARVAFINIAGNAHTRDRVIRRELAISEGDVFRDGALGVSHRRIAALGLFQSVAMKLIPVDDPAQVGIEVRVVERPSRRYQFGGAYGERGGLAATGQLISTNLFGRGQSASLQAQLGDSSHHASIRFTDPRILDSHVGASAELYTERQDWLGFTREATGGSLTAFRPLGEHLRAYLTYRLEKVEAKAAGSPSLDPAGSAEGLISHGRTSSVKAALVYDTRNDPLFPSSGAHATAFAEVAAAPLGSENHFVRTGGHARYYQPLIGPLRLRLNAEVGLVTSPDARGVPLYERYQVGGIADVRGFDPGSLGPRIQMGGLGGLSELSLGGNLKTVLNAEIQFPIMEHIGLSGALFFDAGNAFNLESRYCSAGASGESMSSLCPSSIGDVLGGMRTSVGFGVRWRSSIVPPVSLMWGIPLDRRDGEAPIRFHFSIGGTF